MPSLRRTAVLAALVVLLSASCSADREPTDAAPTTAVESPTAAVESPTATPTPAPAPAPAGATMTISGFAYTVPDAVSPGAQVTVVNRDREAHTVTLDRGAVRLTVLPGATAVFQAPTQPGPHPITCDLHGGMDALLVVG